MTEARPKGWARARIADLGRWIGGSTPSKANRSFWMAGSVPWVSPKDMKVFRVADTQDHLSDEALRTTRIQRIEAGSLLLVVRSGILRHTLPVAVSAAEVTINQDLKALRSNGVATAEYVAHALRRFEKDILDSCTKDGVTVESIEFPLFLDFRIPLAPLPEQHRIVAEIEKHLTRLDAAVAALRRAQAQLKRYRAAVLQAACEGRLVPTEAELARAEDRECEPGDVLLKRVLKERRARWEAAALEGTRAKGKEPEDDAWKAKYVEPVEPETDELAALPEGWIWATVDQISFAVDYGTSAKATEMVEGIPVLRMGNIVDGKLHVDELKYLPTDHSEFPRLLLQTGDFLFNRTNSAELVGKSAVFKGTPSPCSFASYLIRVRFCQDVVSDYPACFVNSLHGRAWIRRVVSQQVGQANVNGSKLRALAIPLPPLAEQKRIATEVDRRLSLAESLENAIADGITRSERLRQSILKDAFEGKLVAQDPHDEPADVLLELIRAERSRQPSARKRRSSGPRSAEARAAQKHLEEALPE